MPRSPQLRGGQPRAFAADRRALPSPGALLCVASAACFGAMAVFGKLAYDEGANVGTLLAVRFTVASGLLWALLVARGRGDGARPGQRALLVARGRGDGARPGQRALPVPRGRGDGARPLRRALLVPRGRGDGARPSREAPPSAARAGVSSLPRRDVLTALALGAVGYAAQAGLFFAALGRIQASLLSLLLYTYPALVTVAAIALGRERASAQRLLALALSSVGLVLVLAGAGAGTLDPLGAALALGAACVYSAYILVGAGVSSRVRPDLLCALVCSGAAVTLTVGALVLGELRPGALTPAGWGWLACLSVISTVAAIGLFFAGLARVGPSTASILSTVEPLTTVLLAFLVFGETLSGAQLAGGALVLGALVVLAGRPLPVTWRPRPAAERVSP